MSYPVALIGFVLHTDPVGVCVPRSRLAEGPKKALGGALEVGLEEVGGNGHTDQATRFCDSKEGDAGIQSLNELHRRRPRVSQDVIVPDMWASRTLGCSATRPGQ